MGYRGIVSELMEIFRYRIVIIVAKLCEELQIDSHGPENEVVEGTRFGRP